MDLGSLAERHRLGPSASAHLAILVERLSTDARAPTSVRDRSGVLRQHVADSLAGLGVPAVLSSRAIADLGSGAGLPGVVLASCLPTADVALVESRRDKCAFLASLVAEMNLVNVRVVCERIEEWGEGRESADLVVARAIAAQPVVLEYAAPLLAVDGTLLEWRGRRDAEDERRASRAAELLGLELIEVRAVEPFPGARDRHLHLFRKRAATPDRFPRRAGVAARKPLGG
jgi:16S rRNA (guanine527-N7)-methyltransferase